MEQTLRQLFDVFLLENSALRPRTINDYRCEIKRFGAMLDWSLTKLTASYCERWAGANQLRRRSIRVAKSALTWCVRSGYIDVNPIAACHGPKIRTKTHVPGIHRVLELPSRFAAGRDRTLITLLIDTGLRINEALALTWDRVCLDRKYITVDRSLDHVGRLQPLKVVGTEREVSLSGTTLKLLELLRHEHRRGPVFRSETGGFVCLHNWRRRVWSLVLKDNDINMRIHDLRHACATLLVEEGLPLAAVQQRLGHTSYETTVKFYTRRSARLSQESASAMDRILNKSISPDSP